MRNSTGKIKVLVVDDSALVREILSKGLAEDPRIEVVGKAPDVYIARDKIVFKKPDVITLDIEMPRMDGVEFLKRLMPQYPLPVIIVSSMSNPGAKVTLDALSHGAVDFVLKPSTRLGTGLKDMINELREKVKTAAGIDVSRWKKNGLSEVSGLINRNIDKNVLEGTTDKVLAIGASTGGTVAITRLLKEFSYDMPGTVIVQHMPPGFTRLFADKLNMESRMEVKEARSGDRIIKGRVLIAPGGYHMEIRRSGGNYVVECYEGEKVNGHTPSVDVLFRSVAKYAGSNALGILLTGMGRDGAKGMLRMKEAGALTIAQDEKTSVVYGMPKEACKLGAVDKSTAIEDINSTAVNMLRSMV